MNRIIKIWLFFMIVSLVQTLPAQEPQAVIEAYRQEPHGDNRFRRDGIMDGNLMRTIYVNNGEIGQWPFQPSGEWPKGTGHSYLDGVCLLVGAKVPVTIGTLDTFITPMSAAYREHVDIDPVTGLPWGWEPVPGYVFEGDGVQASSQIPAISNDASSWPALWPSAIFTFLNVSQTEWINEAEVDGIPGVDDDRDGDVDNFTYWYGFFGRGIKNADIESFFVIDDAADQEWTRGPYFYNPLASDPDRGGLGLRVEARGFQWSQVLAEDNIFWLYDIVNLSDTTYDETVFGFLTDVGIGGTNDSGDDNASFDVLLDIAYGFDTDLIGVDDVGTWGPTGVLGYAYLESPGNPFNNIDDDQDGLIDERRDDGIDNDGDWTPYTDRNGNGQWDDTEPLNDDLGQDGVGPFDRQYNGPDAGEADGIPTLGEPNFDRTDVEESDQIGLSSMSIYRLVDGGGGDGWPKHDEGLWRRMSFQSFDTTLQNANIQMLFASGPFELRQGYRERFSMALLNGSNLEDLVFNKITVQEIYNADYNFSKPPLKPFVTAVASDGKVFLQWDAISEESRDPFLRDSLGNPRKDFEGYLVYRSTEPEWNDIKVITDSRGEARYWKPIAQFDLVNDISGPDPIGINGAHFWRGSNSGLRHSYIDEDVVNGQTYYYAISAYDQGDPERGLETGLQPTETTKIIREDFRGNILFTDINTAVVTPNAAAAGYVPPEIIGDLESVNGLGSGSIEVEVLDPALIQDNATYRVEFTSVNDFPEHSTSTYSVYQDMGDTLLPILPDQDATKVGPENPTLPVDGFVMAISNPSEVEIIPEETGWLTGISNINMVVRQPPPQFGSFTLRWPADYKITFFEDIVDTSFDASGALPVNFKIQNITEDRQVDFWFWDADGSGALSVGDSLSILEPLEGTNFPRFTHNVWFAQPFGQIGRLPEPGDEFLITTSKPFITGDYFEFSTKSAGVDLATAQDQLADVKVVPNPYVVAASWEKRTLFGAGRGDRKIDFIHLPQKCTIRIFTMSGRLVKILDVDNPITDGATSWDLVSDDGIEIAYGVYIYHIDAPGIGKSIGKFAIIK